MRVGARAYPPGRALLPRGRLAEFQTSTPSLLVAFVPRKIIAKVSFRLDSVWYSFLENTEIGKKTETVTQPSVNRLVPKIV